MLWPTIIDLNNIHSYEYYLFMIIWDKCTESCNVWTPKTCVPKETKDRNIKAFNILTNKNEAKTMMGHISCNFKASSIVQHVIQIKNGIIKHKNENVQIIVHVKKIIAGILTQVFLIIAST